MTSFRSRSSPTACTAASGGCSSCPTPSSRCPAGSARFDETIEIITWRQLKLHDKPILVCDVAGSAAPLLAAIEAAIAGGFARPETRALFERTDGIEATIARLRQLRAANGGAAALL